MCCLFGMIDVNHHFTAREKTRMMSILATACEVRGTDATGIAYNSRGSLHIHKRPLPAHKMRIRIPEDAYIIMGHTRMATQGPAKFSKNNHPFLGQAGEQTFALAHNGVLWNDRQLRKKFRLPSTTIATDSYVAVQLIEQKKELSFESLRHMAETVEGSFVFTALNSNNELYFIKGDNPLCIYHFPSVGLYIYASTEEILKLGLYQMPLDFGTPEPIFLACGDILKITQSGQQTIHHFSAPNLWFRPHLSPWRFLSTSTPKGNCCNNTPAQEYLHDLKTIAQYYGYAPDIVDSLVEDGYTLDDVEELLCCGCV